MKKSDYAEFNDVSFAFQVTGVRDGFEEQDIIIDEEELFPKDKKKAPAKNDVQRRIEAMQERARARSEMDAGGER